MKEWRKIRKKIGTERKNGENHFDNDENLCIHLSSMDHRSRKRILPQMTFVVSFSLWHQPWSHDSYIFVTSRYCLWISKRGVLFHDEWWMESSCPFNFHKNINSNNNAYIWYIFWNYPDYIIQIRFDKVDDLKYILKRELISFQFIEHIIIKSCSVALPSISLIKATWQ